jgi:hypothetical protein
VGSPDADALSDEDLADALTALDAVAPSSGGRVERGPLKAADDVGKAHALASARQRCECRTAWHGTASRCVRAPAWVFLSTEPRPSWRAGAARARVDNNDAVAGRGAPGVALRATRLCTRTRRTLKRHCIRGVPFARRAMSLLEQRCAIIVFLFSLGPACVRAHLKWDCACAVGIIQGARVSHARAQPYRYLLTSCRPLGGSSRFRIRAGTPPITQ